MSSLLPSASLTLHVSLKARQQVTPIPLNFPDSANWLWFTQSDVFKLARFKPWQNIFWQGAYTVFGLDRYRSAQRLPLIAHQLPSGLPMSVVPMHWVGYINSAPLWCQRRIEGCPMHWSSDNAYWVGRLCQHLQRQRATRFGCYLHPSSPLKDWASRLYTFLYPRLSLLPEDVRANLLISLRALPTVETAIPLMLDLRQDQFLASHGNLFWIDWEAVVWAPLPFAWALYEVLVPREFRAAFMAGLSTSQRPDIKPHRLSARALLYVMGAFGHTEWSQMCSIDHWMEA